VLPAGSSRHCPQARLAGQLDDAQPLMHAPAPRPTEGFTMHTSPAQSADEAHACVHTPSASPEGIWHVGADAGQAALVVQSW